MQGGHNVVQSQRNRQRKTNTERDREREREREGLTAVGKEADDSATESRPGPEVPGDDAVQSDEQSAGGARAPQREQELGLDELPARPPSAPLHAPVAHVEYQPRVLPVHHAVDDLQQVAAVDTDVAISRQAVAVDTHLLVKHLHRESKHRHAAVDYQTFFGRKCVIVPV